MKRSWNPRSAVLGFVRRHQPVPTTAGARRVFISHISEEAPAADALKELLLSSFGGLRVFVSSDYESITTGEEWFRAIMDGLSSSDCVISLLSRYSVNKRWINFEAGYTLGGGKRLVPMLFRGLRAEEVGTPLAQLHVRELLDEVAVRVLLSIISEQTGLTSNSHADIPTFIHTLERIEVMLPVRALEVRPIVTPQPFNEPLLRFWVENTGNMDVELVEIEVRIPRCIIAPSYTPIDIPGVFRAEYTGHPGDETLILREFPLDGSLDRAYGKRFTLPRIIPPSWSPRLSDSLKIVVKRQAADFAKSVSCKVVARGLRTEAKGWEFADIPVRPLVDLPL